jgi:hypothetical protein
MDILQDIHQGHGIGVLSEGLTAVCTVASGITLGEGSTRCLQRQNIFAAEIDWYVEGSNR